MHCELSGMFCFVWSDLYHYQIQVYYWIFYQWEPGTGNNGPEFKITIGCKVHLIQREEMNAPYHVII